MQFACDLGPRSASPIFTVSFENFYFRFFVSVLIVKEAGAAWDRFLVELHGRTSTTRLAAERVFSLVDAMYGEDQRSALADQLQTGVMLRYNKRMVG